jgi:hypothetical protein
VSQSSNIGTTIFPKKGRNMWQWLNNLMGYAPEEVVEDAASKSEGAPSGDPYRTSALGTPSSSNPGKEESSLVGIIRAAAQQVVEEQNKSERQHLTDKKLRGYFQKSIKFVLSHLDTDSYDFVLIHHFVAGVPSSAFGIFAVIFAKACNQLGIDATVETTYVKVLKPSVRKLLQTIPTTTPRIDINEKVRAMLGT